MLDDKYVSIVNTMVGVRRSQLVTVGRSWEWNDAFELVTLYYYIAFWKNGFVYLIC